jgi:3-oxoacyl-[acyl-carrier protein] reductase
LQEELSVNLLGMYTLTSLIAKRMVSQKKGIIVNVSSLMGKVAAPTMATYSATKFAIVGFTQALRQELAQHNVRVIALLPSLTETDMVRDLQSFRGVIPMTPEQVAQALVIGIENDTAEILVGWQSHLAVLCQRLAPWLLEIILQLATPKKPLPDAAG